MVISLLSYCNGTLLVQLGSIILTQQISNIQQLTVPSTDHCVIVSQEYTFAMNLVKNGKPQICQSTERCFKLHTYCSQFLGHLLATSLPYN
jgi:hypothetical protein